MFKIKVLQVVNDAFVLPYFIGEQFQYFSNKEIDQFVACTGSEFLENYLKKVNIPYFEIAITRTISPLNDLKAICRLFRIIKKNKITHVFGHTPKGAMVAMIASYLAGTKNRVYFRHGLVYETATGAKRRLLILIEHLTAYLSTKVVNVSDSVLEKVNSDGLGRKKKDIILSKGTCNGINTERYSRLRFESTNSVGFLRKSLNLDKTDFVIGFVGRLVKDKGIIDLMNAWEVLRDRGVKAKLLLIGPFETRDGIPERIRRQIMEDSHIIHVDFIEDVAAYYMLIDVLVLPSYREGFPTVVLEASSMSIPVLTTRVTGCVDAIIDSHTGVHITHEPRDIASKIEIYYKNPELRRLHGKNGREFVDRFFRQEVVWKEIEEKLIFN
ncbi:glycosyltransferase family 4 protein [Sphingobacterium paucimobilis]|uniref:Glycosyl transferase family 1 domain-containing protein n=1 Tax=Sphingobacterium paucimobilis HER1398 TaxID=1346330 RepID=U2IYE7_9SPHI|nr:glycosyltransferase family 4 protein [Sphingobacterium paucimobilis]ERJ57729.1 hypothetical protein M472_03015 [Sphingobacterium paucimobilis HER1398]